jgi:hypothetical protein
MSSHPQHDSRAPCRARQAEDRAHRIGQTREVLVLVLVSAGTIEEDILDRARQKRDLDAKVIQAGMFNDRRRALKCYISLSLFPFFFFFFPPWDKELRCPLPLGCRLRRAWQEGAGPQGGRAPWLAQVASHACILWCASKGSACLRILGCMLCGRAAGALAPRSYREEAQSKRTPAMTGLVRSTHISTQRLGRSPECSLYYA